MNHESFPKFKVHAAVKPTLIQQSAGLSSGISGTLYIQVDDFYFPGEGWGDYVVPVLDWWATNVMRLHNPETEVKNIFMDGSCFYRMRRCAGTGDIAIILHEHERSMIGEYTINYSRCLASFRGALKSVLNELRGLGFDGNGEASSLRLDLEQIVRLEAQIKARGLP